MHIGSDKRKRRDEPNSVQILDFLHSLTHTHAPTNSHSRTEAQTRNFLTLTPNGLKFCFAKSRNIKQSMSTAKPSLSTVWDFYLYKRINPVCCNHIAKGTSWRHHIFFTFGMCACVLMAQKCATKPTDTKRSTISSDNSILAVDVVWWCVRASVCI